MTCFLSDWPLPSKVSGMEMPQSKEVREILRSYKNKSAEFQTLNIYINDKTRNWREDKMKIDLLTTDVFKDGNLGGKRIDDSNGFEFREDWNSDNLSISDQTSQIQKPRSYFNFGDSKICKLNE